LRSSQSPKFDGNEEKADDLPLYRLCQMTATSYLTSQKERYHKIGKAPLPIRLLDPRYFELAEEDDKYDARIYKPINSLPRAYLISHWHLCRSHDEALDQIANSTQSQFNPATEALLEPSAEANALPTPETANSVATTDNGNTVNVITGAGDSLRLETKAAKAALLILTDQYYPGWQARLDGKPVSILRANAMQRAVFVPAGAHTVQFDYKPASLFWGFLLAAAGLLTTLASTLLFKPKS
jgi:hypothetical protein